MVYVGDKNALNELIGYYDGLKEIIGMVQQENAELKKQLEYLRSGEYLNQLKFERNMLEDIVQNGEVSKEDKEFIDMTHRNTELLEENQQLKKDYAQIVSNNCDYLKLEQQIELYKSVIKEIRECIEELYDNTDDTTCYDIDKHRKEFLLQILDKGDK